MVKIGYYIPKLTTVIFIKEYQKIFDDYNTGQTSDV
jgi:hypothetical protein